MRINHNIAALNTYRQLNSAASAQSKSMEKLSSGLRINKAGDDAAGLAISEKMRGQIRGLEMGSKNAQDGISFIQTAEGALNETHSILQRMRELATQSANDTNTDADRSELQKEVDQLSQEITRIANNTEFNTKSLLNGAVDDNNVKAATFHIGANEGQNLELTINAMDAASLGVAGNKVTAAVSAATDVNSATVTGVSGTGIVNGASLTVSAAVDVAGASASTGAIGGITLTTTTNTSELNGVTISYVDGGDSSAVGVAYDEDNKTFTVTGDFNNTDTGGTYTAGTAVATALNTALTANGYTAQVTGSGTGTATTGGNTGTYTGGSYDTMDVTVTDGTLSETVSVTSNATSVSFTDKDKFAGLKINTDGSLTTSTAATVSIGGQFSSAATFNSGEKTADAVAYGGIDISTQSSADDAITVINTAIESVSAERSKLGAYQNRLEHTINNLGTSAENLTAAESRIRDVDMAKEMMSQTKNSILSQAAQAMLAQANQQPQGVLQLLR